jgi:hypothetical protein
VVSLSTQTVGAEPSSYLAHWSSLLSPAEARAVRLVPPGPVNSVVSRQVLDAQDVCL